MVIPLAQKLTELSNKLLSLPLPPESPIIGTKTSIDMREESAHAKNYLNSKKGHTKQEKKEKQKEYVMNGQMQEINMPDIDSSFVGYNIKCHLHTQMMMGITL